MALRVLLADESTTIKKVMQLALQDFAVEVKAVHAGVDVVEVARSFQPDIVFADVLLQKKNGYEVCTDLKQDPTLRTIPVVLMWSSFMDLDEKLAVQANADSRLEKPFDVESLRKMVLELVPKTRSQRLAHFLNFPESFSQPLKQEEAKKKEAVQPATPAIPATPVPPPTMAAPPPPVVAAAPPPGPAIAMPPPPPKPMAAPPPPTAAPTSPPPSSVIAMPPPVSAPAAPASMTPPPPRPEQTASSWNMESFDDIAQFTTDDPADEGFAEFKLTTLAPVAEPEPSSPSASEMSPRSESVAHDDDDPWSHQDLSRFKLDLPPVSIESEELPVAFEIPDADVGASDFLLKTPHMPSRSTSEEFAMETPISLELDESDQTAYREYELPAQGGLQEADEFSADGGEMAFAGLHSLSENLETDANPIDGVDLTQDYLQSSPQPAPVSASLSGSAPQLSAERLEEIIRAQSREIIESVVRKIVPDIASALIKKELERLLEDTGVHDRP